MQGQISTFNTHHVFQKCLIQIYFLLCINYCLFFLYMQVIYMGVSVYTPALALNAGEPCFTLNLKLKKGNHIAGQNHKSCLTLYYLLDLHLCVVT